MKKINKTILFAMLLLSFLFVGCTSGNSNSISNDIDNSNNQDINTMQKDSVASYEGSNSTENKKENKNTKTQSNLSQEKIVYTCDMTIQTLKYKETVTNIKNKIKEYNGIIEQETQTDEARDWYYNNYKKNSATLHNYIIIRIPSNKYEQFLQNIEGEGKVISKSMNAQNISKTYYEKEAVIKSLEIQEKRLLTMMESTKSINEMITVEKRLTEVQTQLNTYKTQLASMNKDVEYSTININVDEVLEYTKDKENIKTNTFLDRLKYTIKDSWKTFLNVLEGLLFLAIRAFPILLIFAIIVLIIIKFVKFLDSKAKKK